MVGTPSHATLASSSRSPVAAVEREGACQFAGHQWVVHYALDGTQAKSVVIGDVQQVHHVRPADARVRDAVNDGIDAAIRDDVDLRLVVDMFLKAVDPELCNRAIDTVDIRLEVFAI